MLKFNKTLLGKNIKYLATQKRIKVGDIENEAGVSAGYLSRLANEDNKNNFPIMDLIFMISQKFDVSVNTLLSVDFSAFSPNEILLSQFFDKLSKDTENNTIVWELESKEKLKSFEDSGNHPLFFPYSTDMNTSYYYSSAYESNTTIAGDSYKVSVGDKLLYMMTVQKQGEPEIGFELYFVSHFYDGSKKIEQICMVYPDSELFNQLNDLRNVAAESSRHVKLSDSVRDTINNYLIHNDKDADVMF